MFPVAAGAPLLLLPLLAGAGLASWGFHDDARHLHHHLAEPPYPPRGRPPPPLSPQETMVAAVNDLGLALLAAHNEDNENNIAISPYGALSVLIALIEGLQGEASYEILHAAHLPEDKSIIRVGLRDIHRHLKSYFIPHEGFLSGLVLNHDNVTFTREYEDVLKYYGFSYGHTNNSLCPTAEGTPKEVTTVIPVSSTGMEPRDQKEDKSGFTTESSLSTTLPSTTLISDETSTVASTTTTGSSSTTTEEVDKKTTKNEISSTTTTTATTVAQAADTTTVPTMTTTTVQTTTTTTEAPTTTTQSQTTMAQATTTTTEATTTTIQAAATTIVQAATTTVAPATITTSQSTTTLMAKSDPPVTTTISSTTSPSEVQETTLSSTTVAEQQTATTESSSTTMETPTEGIRTTKAISQSALAAFRQSTSFPMEATELLSEESKLTTNIPTTESVFLSSPNQLILGSTMPAIQDYNSEAVVFAESTSEFQNNFETTTFINDPVLTLITTDPSVSETTSFSSENTFDYSTYYNSDTGTQSYQDTSENPTTENDVNANITTTIQKRAARSVVDYIIARAYDDHPQHHTYYIPEEPLTFLVYGKYREANLNFMKYNTVLPFFYVPHLDTLALSFPLDTTKYYLLLLLPADDTGIDKLICDLRFEGSLNYIVKNLKPTHVAATIPSFKLKGFVILTETFQKLGINKVFEPRQADFSPMTDDRGIYVTNIEQAITVTIRNYMESDNKGTSRNLQNYEPVHFKADHPFLYFVIDSELQVTLMAGKVVNPLNSRIR